MVPPLTFPDPEEQERDGSASRGHAKDHAGDELGDTHATFARIVAGLQAESEEPRWSTRGPEYDAPHDSPQEPPHDTGHHAGEDHFDPPEPPPLPTPRPRTVGGVLTLAIGVLLLFGPNVLNLGERAAVLLGLLALTAGVAWLMVGLRPDPPPDGSDDGAQL